MAKGWRITEGKCVSAVSRSLYAQRRLAARRAVDGDFTVTFVSRRSLDVRGVDLKLGVVLTKNRTAVMTTTTLAHRRCRRPTTDPMARRSQSLPRAYDQATFNPCRHSTQTFYQFCQLLNENFSEKFWSEI